MVESISKIQQLLAESKFVDAQNIAETELIKSEGSENVDLWELLFDSLHGQNKELPAELLLNFIERVATNDIDRATKWLPLIKESEVFRQRITRIRILIAEKKGQPAELYQLISRYHIMRWENRTPSIPEEISQIVAKYFPSDFHLNLQMLALDLLRFDFDASEKRVKELCLGCYEKSSVKGRKEKLLAIFNILKSADKLYSLEVYKNLVLFLSEGISDKRDFKKIIELVIYIEEFSLQVIILDFLINQSLPEIAQDYAVIIRQNPRYNYVYIEKYFPSLRSFFIKKTTKRLEDHKFENEPMDLTLENTRSSFVIKNETVEVSDHEKLLAQLLKYNEFDQEQLWDVAIGFIQSEFFYAGLKACELMNIDHDKSELKLKCGYLKIICLSKLGDYRAVIDKCFEALMISEKENDFLSFLYAKADAYIHLGDIVNAKADLQKILKIDERYRMTKEKLENLNAI